MKKKILFLIHDLGHGGAEKVLVNLVNHMDRSQFDITVTALFGGGVNERFLVPDIRFRRVFPRMIPGNSHLMKLLSPKLLHRLCIREHYDIEVSYLEGPCARIISGCEDPATRLVSWVHCTIASPGELAMGFRSPEEACSCYGKMDRMVFVSDQAREIFLKTSSFQGETAVLYNTNDTSAIRSLAGEEAPVASDGFRWCSVGRLIPVKGIDRMLRIQKKLRDDGADAHLYLLGDGPLAASLRKQAQELEIADSVTFLGYQTNPYKYVAKCDLFVCASHAEGFSTAATEALIVGTPVCTVDVSGMKEMLGEHNEFGLVTENSEDALYAGIRSLLDDRELLAHYRSQAALRGKHFSTEETVHAAERMLLNLFVKGL